MLPCSTSPHLLMNAVIPGNSMHTDYVYYVTWSERSTGLEGGHVVGTSINNCLTTGSWCEHGIPFSHLKFLETMHYSPAYSFTIVWNKLTGKNNLVIIKYLEVCSLTVKMMWNLLIVSLGSWAVKLNLSNISNQMATQFSHLQALFHLKTVVKLSIQLNKY